MVRSEDPHAVEGRRRALGRGQASPDHLVLPQLERDERQAARSASPSATPAQPPRSRPRASPSGPATGRPRGTHRSEREQAIPGEREEADHRRRRMGRRAQPCRPPIAAPPPPRSGAASSRVLRERRRRHVGRSPPSRAGRGCLGAQRPLSCAASPRRRPPNGRLRSQSRCRPQSRPCPRAPAFTHGARRLHAAASSAARRKGKAACAAASRHPPAGSPAPGRPVRPLAGRRARLEQAAVSLRPRRPALGSGPAGAAWLSPGPAGGGGVEGSSALGQAGRGSQQCRGPACCRYRSEEARLCVTPSPAGPARVAAEDVAGRPQAEAASAAFPAGQRPGVEGLSGEPLSPVVPWETGAAGYRGVAPVDRPPPPFDGIHFVAAGPERGRSCAP